MIKLSIQDFDLAYNIFKVSFPKEELRPYDKMKSLFINDKLYFYGKKEGNELISCIIVWEFDTFIFLENFATVPKFRGKGIGKQLLLDVCTNFNKTTILEAEDPYDEISQRRIGFYKRNNFIVSNFGYKQPPFYDTGETFFLKILCYQKSLSENEFKNMKTIIFKEVYEKSLVE